MSDSNEPTTTSPNAPKKRGRPAKVKPEDGVLASLIEGMQRQITQLQTALAEKNAEAAAKVTVPPAPEASPERAPGSYVEVARDHAGAPVYRKVRWTKPAIAKAYPSVTFEPRVTIDVAPHGVTYHLIANQEVTVPSIVKDVYQQSIREQEARTNAYRPVSIQEKSDLETRAKMEMGTRQWSRVERLGVGLLVADEKS